RAALAGRPYVTVRDRHSARRLAEAGVERPIEVVPASALLIDRIMPAESLRARLARLRHDGGYPAAGSPVLVAQGCELLLPHVDGVAAAAAQWLAARPGVAPEVVVVETGRCRGDAVYADALARSAGPAPGRRRRCPPPGAPGRSRAGSTATSTASPSWPRNGRRPGPGSGPTRRSTPTPWPTTSAGSGRGWPPWRGNWPKWPGGPT